ncbi:MAG: AraC family transcriptional regulator [Bacteroidales bacterium]|nr:AraC family transcriptional regulator [Bacteroidales bacterium]
MAAETNESIVKAQALSPSGRDMNWGLYSTFAAKMDFAPGQQYPIGTADGYYRFTPDSGRILREYQITYISRGGGWFLSESTGRKKIPLREGSIFILFPGEWHSYSPEMETGWCEYSIGFKGSWMDDIVGGGFVTPDHPVLNVRVSDTLQKLFSDFIRISTEQHSGYQQALSGMIGNILGYALYLESNASLDVNYFEKNITRAKNLIQEEYPTMNPKLVASRLGLGYSNFRSMFKKYTGTSPAKYILSVKIFRAKEMLTYTDMTVKEVAVKVGVDNYDYFSTLFKSDTGMTPLAYREFSRGHNK